ncbi:hypothetical protein [Marinobacter pelagius]|uniref:Uncharacterized protein n=1 Tax=Marinobacter pelagius TaxID=379482 RepID=A0A1I4W6Y4_9GAMM|nr:hypothetical protein [Marinobacter pelagius]SFN08966.1 hypothetical protein SAMN04487961_2113 [Marinobacter pelagius]
MPFSPLRYVKVTGALRRYTVEGPQWTYPVMMGTIYTLIDPEEIMIIKEQAQEVKNKAGY